MSELIPGSAVLVVPSMPVPMATNARLFVIARISGRSIDEMRSTIWAHKPLRFEGLGAEPLRQLNTLFASWGIRTEMERVEDVKPMSSSPIEATTAPSLTLAKKERVPQAPETKQGKPVLLQSKIRKGNKRFFLVKSAWVSGAFGLVMALAFFIFFPVSGYILGFISVPDQHLSDAMAGWIAGALPSTIPALDVNYEAPQTSHALGFFISIGILGILAIIAFVFKKSSAWFWLFGSLLLFHSSISVFAEHRLALLYFGHAMEIFFCSLFLFRAFTGTQVIFYSERALYATAGWLLWLENLRFGWMLVQSGQQLKPSDPMGMMDTLATIEFGMMESLDTLGVALFTLNLAIPSIVLALMIAMELRRPQILIHRT